MNRSSTSPYRATGRYQATSGSSEPLEQLIKNLERENNSLVEEVNILKNKSKKVIDLESQIDMVLKHNTQLLNENERLAKLMSQKKAEVDTWKGKYESYAVNRNATSQLENRKLINQIQKLKEEITDIEHLKNMQINQLKNQHHLEIQSIKRGNLGSNEKYQLEIRKFKEYCEKKQYQISDLNMKLVRLSKETDFQIGKLREEKDRLRGDLLYEETQHKKEIDSLKSKFEYNFHSQIDNLKKQHLNQAEALDYENTKLKEVINSKNVEIEQILTKNLKVKNNYEDALDLLKKENDDLKEKIFETERISQIQLSNLKEKLEGIKQSELSLLKNAHSNQFDLLSREMKKLQEIIDQRNYEIETLAKEKIQVRKSLEAEIVRAKAELAAQVNENMVQAQQHEISLNNNEDDFKAKNEEMLIMENSYETQVATLKTERDKLEELHRTALKSLEQERNDHSETKSVLQAEIKGLADKNANLKDSLERESRRSGSESDDLKKMAELKAKQADTKIKGLVEQNAVKDTLIVKLNDVIKLKEQEVKSIQEKVALLQNCERELRKEARESLSRWQAKESQYNELIKSQTKAVEASRKRELQELRNIHENKLSTLRHQIKELERQIEGKNNSLNDLKRRYEELVNKFEELFAQRAAQKNLDIKIPGWTPDVIATKSLFDVFLKNKVLEYCS